MRCELLQSWPSFPQAIISQSQGVLVVATDVTATGSTPSGRYGELHPSVSTQCLHKTIAAPCKWKLSTSKYASSRCPFRHCLALWRQGSALRFKGNQRQDLRKGTFPLARATTPCCLSHSLNPLQNRCRRRYPFFPPSSTHRLVIPCLIQAGLLPRGFIHSQRALLESYPNTLLYPHSMRRH